MQKRKDIVFSASRSEARTAGSEAETTRENDGSKLEAKAKDSTRRRQSRPVVMPATQRVRGRSRLPQLKRSPKKKNGLKKKKV